MFKHKCSTEVGNTGKNKKKESTEIDIISRQQHNKTSFITEQVSAEEVEACLSSSSSALISISITKPPKLDETNANTFNNRRTTSNTLPSSTTNILTSGGFSHHHHHRNLSPIESYSGSCVVENLETSRRQGSSSSKKKRNNNNSSTSGGRSQRAVQNSLCIIDLTSAGGTSAASASSLSKSHYNFLSSIDSPIGYEIVKLVRALNKAVATHVALAALLGGSGDGPDLRDDLRRARRTAQEAAASAKTTLISFLLDPRWADRERMELERVWCLLLCCLDSLEASMQRSLNLLREFSLADGNNVLIQTGFEPSSHHHLPLPRRHSFRQNQSSSRSSSGKNDEVDKLTLEGAEASQLCKELFELRSQLQELKSAVEIRLFSPAALEESSPAILRRKPLRIDTLVSLNGTDLFLTARPGVGGGGSISCDDEKESIEESDEDATSSEGEGITPPQRRCICWIITFMMTVFGMVMLLGIVIALFS